MGAYHGFYGFECFSHKKGVLKTATWFDKPLTYAPYDNKKIPSKTHEVIMLKFKRE